MYPRSVIDLDNIRVVGTTGKRDSCIDAFDRVLLESRSISAIQTIFSKLVQFNTFAHSFVMGYLSKSPVAKYLREVKQAPKGLYNRQLILTVIMFALGGMPKGIDLSFFSVNIRVRDLLSETKPSNNLQVGTRELQPRSPSSSHSRMTLMLHLIITPIRSQTSSRSLI